MQLTEYEHKTYITTVYVPKKNEITATAMYFIKEFIRNAGSINKMEDLWLTKRQNQIMNLMAEGLDRQEICDALEIELSTLSTQLVDIYSRYGIEGNFKNSKAVVRYLKNTGRLEE